MEVDNEKSKKCHSHIIEPRRDKTNKMTVRPAKTQISLFICPVLSVFAVRSMGN